MKFSASHAKSAETSRKPLSRVCEGLGGTKSEQWHGTEVCVCLEMWSKGNDVRYVHTYRALEKQEREGENKDRQLDFSVISRDFNQLN